VPTEIARLVQLVYLDLGGNQISSLPPEIGKLNNLYQLALHHNNLVSLPSEIANMHNLEILLLNGNKLKGLPNEIGRLKKLRRLRAAFNAIEQFPSQILEIEGLYDLNFRGNAFCLSGQEQNTVKRVVPVTVYGRVQPQVIQTNEPINLTIAVFNGLSSTIHYTNAEAVDVLVELKYDNGNLLELYSSQLKIKAPDHMVRARTVEIGSGAVMYLHTDGRRWKLKNGWKPGRYEMRLQIENLRADEFCKLSILSAPVCFEIK